jgi:phosphopantothenate-cysteine ligase
MACNEEWEEYFHHFSPPSSLADTQKAVRDFAAHNRSRGLNLVLVTSGGTTVPLENNTVRFVDNFSIGRRGSSSAEYFLEEGYAVVFLHRQHSLQPFSRQFDRDNFLEYLQVEVSPDGTERVGVKSTVSAKLMEVLKTYDEVKESRQLLLLTFVTVSDYLFVLRACAETLSVIGCHVMFYLAAAVSDFYVPTCEMPEHKIQSSAGPLELKMQPTPKLLSPLVKDWAKKAFVVSFKVWIVYVLCVHSYLLLLSNLG